MMYANVAFTIFLRGSFMWRVCEEVHILRVFIKALSLMMSRGIKWKKSVVNM